MSEFKGTKGEWRYEVKYGKNKPRITVQIPIRENLNKELILGTIGEDDCTVETCCCVEEHANAKLIAQSPVMYKFLIEVIRDFESDFVVDGEIVDDPNECYIIQYKTAKKIIETINL